MGSNLVANNQQPAGDFSDYLIGIGNHAHHAFNVASDGIGQVMQFTSPTAAGGWAAFGVGMVAFALLKKTDGTGASRNERLVERVFNTHRGTWSHRLMSTASMAFMIYAASATAFNYFGNTVHGHGKVDERYATSIQVDNVRRDVRQQVEVPQAAPVTRTTRRMEENKRDMVDPFANHPIVDKQAANKAKQPSPFDNKP